MPDDITPAPTPTPTETPWHASIFQPDGNFVERWQEKLPADLEPHRAMLANFNSMGGIAKALNDNMTAARSKPAGLVIPGEDATPEAKTQFQAELKKLYGVPEGVDGYQLAPPANLPPGVTWNEETAATFKAKAHSLGLTPTQAQELIQFDLDRLQHAQESQSSEMAALQQQEQADMAKRWGDKVDANLHTAQRLAATLGLPNPAELFDPKHPAFAGVDMTDAFARLAGMLGEKQLVPGPAVQNFDPITQAKHIMETDPAWRDQNHPNHAAVAARVTELYKAGSK